MTTLPQSARRLTAWGAVLVAASLSALFLSGWWSLPLTVVTLGCAEVRAFPEKDRPPLCEFSPESSLRLFINDKSESSLSLFSGIHKFPITRRSVEGGVILEFKPSTQAKTLWLLARRGPRLALRRIELGAFVEPNWLRDAYTLWQGGQGERALKLLHDQPEASLSDANRARRAFILARIARETDRISDAERFGNEALANSRAAGLLAQEVATVAFLARLYDERFHQVDRAEKLWLDSEALLEQLPERKPWQLLSLAIYRQEVWDLDGALDRLKEAEFLARRFEDNKLAVELTIQRATISYRTGQRLEGEKAISGLPLDKLRPCRRADAQEAVGRLRLLSSTAGDLADSIKQREAARTVLSSALTLAEKDCKQVDLMTTLLTRIGQLEAADGNAEKGAEYALRARALVQRPTPLLELDLFDLEGRRALAARNFAASKSIYERMLTAARRLDADEAIWQAMQGLAQTAAHDDEERALRFYRLAETFLDERSQLLSLGSGRGGFLGRFELGTRRLVDLLHEQKRFDEAYAVSRRARLRGLRSLTLLSRIDRLDAQHRASFEQALAKYHAERATLTRVISEEADAALSNLDEMQRSHREQSDRVLAAMAAAMKTLGENHQVETFHPPASGEVRLLCHPALVTYRCYLETSTGVIGKAIDLRVDAELKKMPFAELSAKLLSPFTEQLRSATHVSIVSYGSLRPLDFHRLPFDGGMLDGGGLEGKRQVVYSLDLEGEPQPVVAPRPDGDNARALLLIDRELNLPHIRAAGAPLVETLSRTGWQLKSAIGDTRGLGVWPGEPAKADATLTREETLASLPHARLFVYAGHAIFAATGGWQHELRTSQHVGLFIGDILTLPHAPEVVTLFACESAQSAEETGGLEGVGLAQAFLLRGSRFALGTVRKVDDQLASVVAGAFFRSLAAGETSPVRALRTAIAEAQRTLQISEPRSIAEINPKNDLGAFRIFTAR